MDLRLGHNQKEPTHLYVMECAGRVKIGIAVNVEARMELLQLACPLKIALLHKRLFASRTTARLAERSLHLRFAEQRLWGEWFEVTPTAAVDAVIAAREETDPVKLRGRRRRWTTRQELPVATAGPRAIVAPDISDEDIEALRPLAAVLNFSSPHLGG